MSEEKKGAPDGAASGEGGGQDEKEKEKPKSKKAADEKERAKEVKQLDLEQEFSLNPPKRGDYVVQVHLIEGRELKGRDFGGISDPVVIVQVMNLKQHTKTYKKQLNVSFDEVMYFEFSDLEPKQLLSGKVNITVWDANAIRRNELIGGYQFDLGHVYYGKHHEIYRQWVALSDHTGEHEGVQGYLKCSIVALGPGDEQYTHSAKDADDEASGMLSVLMPPEVPQRPFVLHIKCFECRELPIMDTGLVGGKCDPYVRVDFANFKLKTRHGNGLSYQWNEELLLPVMEPTMSTDVRVNLFDWDRASRDDRISTFSVSYAAIKKKAIGPRWFMLYGAPEGVENDYATKMNDGFVTASAYRGRVLLEFSVQSTEGKMPHKEVKMVNSPRQDEQPLMQRYCLQCDLYEGSEIASKLGGVRVELCCGGFTASSPDSDPVDGRAFWYHIFRDIPMDFPEELDQVPDVFVYLVGKKKRVSFARIPFRELMDRGWNVPPTWMELNECLALDALDEDEFPGSLLISVRAGRLAAVPAAVSQEARPLSMFDFAPSDDLALTVTAGDTGADEKDKEAKVPLLQMHEHPGTAAGSDKVSMVGTLTVRVLRARDCPAGDIGGTSDPYCKLQIGKQQHKTKTVKKTLNPRWNESFVFREVLIEDALRIGVYDHNDVTSDELLGEVAVDLRMQQLRTGVPFGKDWVCEEWFMMSEKNAKAMLLLKFEFAYLPLERSTAIVATRRSQAVQQQAQKNSLLQRLRNTKDKFSSILGGMAGLNELGRPSQAQFQLRVHLFMGRNLPASDASGLADPYVVVRCCGKKLCFPKRLETLNPSWFETRVVNLLLPVPLSYAPGIQAFVYDWDQFSKDDPIGRLSLPITAALDMNPSVEEIRPKWFQLRDWNNEIVEGAELLMSFDLLTSAELAAAEGMPMPKLQPVLKPMVLDVMALGVRELSSLMGIHKPMVDFTIPEVPRYSTSPATEPTPRNANFLQRLRVPFKMPVDELYAPNLSINVRDTLFGGLVKRLVGNSSMSLAELMGDDEDDSIELPAEPSAAATDVADGKASNASIDSKDDAKQLQPDPEAKWAAAAVEAKAGQRAPSAASIKRAQNHKHNEEFVQRALAEKKRAEVSEAKRKEREKDLAIRRAQEEEKQREAREREREEARAQAQRESDDRERELKKKDKEDEEKDPSDMAAPLLGAAASSVVPGGSILMGGLGDKDKSKPAVPKDYGDPKAEFAFHVDKPELYPEGEDGDDAELPPYMRGRVVVDNELEDEMVLQPFRTIELFTGQKNAGVFGEKYRRAGCFKGLIRLRDADQEEKKDDLLKEMLKAKPYFLRLYVLRGLKLSPADPDGLADPYLKIKIGKKKISTRERYHPKTLEPEFFESFDIPCTIPGDGRFTIEVWDYDGLGDDLIGSTTIDIEDRWFTKAWRDLPLNPLERRTLHSPKSSFSQGKLELWVDVVSPQEAKKFPITVIRPPVPEKFELRLIVWGTKDMVSKDEITDQNDLYVTGQVSPPPDARTQSTDTHMRAKKGIGNFNWRMKYPLELPARIWPRLRLAIWDMDILAANDSICECIIPLKGICKRALKKKNRIQLFKDNRNRFWLNDLRHPNFEGQQGRCEISLEILPIATAEQLTAGFGRDAPNTNPFLPEPEGRMKWDLLHPFDLLKDLLGPKLYYKICCFCCCMVVLAGGFMLAPFIQSLQSAKSLFD